MATNQVNEFMSKAQIRVEALNIASREAVVRAYPDKAPIDVAKDMVAFIEDVD